MKKISLLIGMVAISSSAFAIEYGGIVSLQCIPTNPCQYVTQGMKYCVSNVTLSGRAGSRGTETIRYRPANIGHEILLQPQRFTVLIGHSANWLSFQDTTGDQWGQIKTSSGALLVGKITVDQDFEFEVNCQNKALGFV
ncbi:MAG: hypothetical protein AB7H97_05130 [Pseudobdellovibrionaceae bacterium]